MILKLVQIARQRQSVVFFVFQLTKKLLPAAALIQIVAPSGHFRAALERLPGPFRRGYQELGVSPTAARPFQSCVDLVVLPVCAGGDVFLPVSVATPFINIKQKVINNDRLS
jgi:hypothetical protein